MAIWQEQQQVQVKNLNFFKKITSIGKSSRSRPKNKHKRRNYKKYKGQGK